MKKLLLSLVLLGLPAAALAQAGPQIPLSGSIGVPGSAPTLCSAAVVMSADADLTMSASQFACNSLYVTSTVSLTATRNIIAPLNYGQQFVVTNATTGGQSIQVIGASGSGVSIPSGQTEIVNSPNGTNYVAASSVAAAGAVFPAMVAQPTPASTTFLQALNNAKNVPVHIAVMGDSFTVACQPIGGPGTGPVNCTNRWTEQLRIQLQAIYGSNGTGVYPVIVAAPAVINNQAWSCTGSFTTSTILGPTQSGSGAGSTLVALGPGASCTFHDNRNIAWDTLNTYCGTNASSVGIAVNIDSGAFTGTACGSTTGSATAHVVTLAAVNSTLHSVSFTNSAGSGTAYLYGAAGVAGTTGVSVDNVGFGGATSNAYGSAVTTQLAFSDLIPGGTQAMLFMDQTNDASLAVPTGTFSTNVQNVITHEQALASAPTVVLTIPPVDVINNTSPMGAYTAIQLGLCTSNSLTCVNIQDRGTTVGSTTVGWGTTFPGCPNVLWDCTGGGSAGIHPNDAGSLDEAQLIYARLVNPVGVGAAPCTNNCTISDTTGSSPALTIQSAYNLALDVHSSNSAGPFICLQGTASGVDDWCMASASSATATGGKTLLIGDINSGIFSWAQQVASSGAGFIKVPSLIVNCWATGNSVTTLACDTGLSRDSADVVDLGNGTQGDKSGTLNLATLNATSASVLGSNTASDITYFDNATGHLADSGILRGALALLNSNNQFGNFIQTFGLTGSGDVQISNNGIQGVNTSTAITYKIDNQTGGIGPGVFTVSTLPAASSLQAGTMLVVTDSNTFTPGTCTAGGSDYMIAVTNGTAWSCH